MLICLHFLADMLLLFFHDTLFVWGDHLGGTLLEVWGEGKDIVGRIWWSQKMHDTSFRVTLLPQKAICVHLAR